MSVVENHNPADLGAGAYLVLGEGDTIIGASAGAEALLGFDAEQLRGKPLATVVSSAGLGDRRSLANARVVTRDGSDLEIEAIRTQCGESLTVVTLRPARISGERVRTPDERRWKAALMNVPAAIAVLRGPDHIYELSNPANDRLAGRTLTLGAPAREALPELAGQGLFELLDRVYETGEPFVGHEVPVRLTPRDDDEPREVFLNGTYQALRDASGEVEGIVAFAYDVTEQVRARKYAEALADDLERQREALAESEARARRLQDSGVIGVVFWSRGGELLNANDAFLRIVGYDRADLVAGNVRWRDMTPPEFAAADERAFAEMDQQGFCQPFEKEYVRKDGTRVPVQLGVALWEGRTDSGVAWVLDISARKRLEQEERRRRRAAEFLALFSTSLAASLELTTMLGNVTELLLPEWADYLTLYLQNDAGALELVALKHVNPAKAAALRDLEERYAPSRAEGHGAAVVMRERRPWLVTALDEPELVTDHGASYIERLRGLGGMSAMFLPLLVQGRAIGAMCLGMSEGDRRFDSFGVQVGEELAHRLAVSVDNAKLFAMTQRERLRAEQANRAKDELLSVTSHELRTPLNAILGWSQMLHAGQLSAEQRARAVEIIQRNAKVQIQLVDDLLDVSRVITGKLRLSVAGVEVVPVVEAALDVVRPGAEAKGLALHVELDQDTGVLTGDSARLQQVFWNLLSNAVKFTPRGGRIDVRLRRDASYVEFTVADTGQGIDPIFLPHLFQPFRQQDGSITRSFGGLGLGLAIVKHLVELHGGQVEARSDGAGKGATFAVRIPSAPLLAAVAAPTPEPPSVTERPAAELRAAPELRGVHLLVVDDDPDARELLQTILEDRGARVSTAGSLTDAFQAFRRDVPDLVVSDVGMPGGSGYDLIRRIRELPDQAGGRVPAIALTAYTSAADRRRALMEGFTAHSSKPMDPQDLIAVIAALIGRARRVSAG